MQKKHQKEKIQIQEFVRLSLAIRWIDEMLMVIDASCFGIFLRLLRNFGCFFCVQYSHSMTSKKQPFNPKQSYLALKPTCVASE